MQNMFFTNPQSNKQNCSRQYSIFFSLLFRKNKIRYFMCMVCLVDDSHDMSSLVIKIKVKLKILSAAVLISDLRVKISFFKAFMIMCVPYR